MLGTGEQTLSKEMKIEVITYEQERLDFFTKAMNLAQKRYNRLFEIFKDDPYLSEGTTIVSDAGRELRFYQDIVEMLESGNRKEIEGEWIYHIDDLFPAESSQECSICHENEYITLGNDNFCPNCGTKMKRR